MKLEQLTFTRFVAAIVVILYHVKGAHLGSNSVIGSLLGVGNSAVSYFFVLSGFILIVSSLRDGQLPIQIDKRKFWRNRFARIYPLYLFALILTILTNILTGNDKVGDMSVGSIAASTLLIQAWWPPYAIQLNSPGWSLSVETLFYILFPLLYGSTLRQSTRTILIVTGTCWVASLAVYMFMLDRNMMHNLSSYFPLLHINTFLVGVTAGVIFVRHSAWLKVHYWYLTVMFLMSLLISLWLVLAHLPVIRYYHNGLFAPLFALFIVWFSTQNNGLTRLLSRPLPVLLGEISYGLYLLQVPVGVATFFVTYSILHWPGWLNVLVYLGVLCITSLICYYAIEQPSRRFIRHWPTRTLDVPASQPVNGFTN